MGEVPEHDRRARILVRIVGIAAILQAVGIGALVLRHLEKRHCTLSTVPEPAGWRQWPAASFNQVGYAMGGAGLHLSPPVYAPILAQQGQRLVDDTQCPGESIPIDSPTYEDRVNGRVHWYRADTLRLHQEPAQETYVLTNHAASPAAFVVAVRRDPQSGMRLSSDTPRLPLSLMILGLVFAAVAWATGSPALHRASAGGPRSRSLTLLAYWVAVTGIALTLLCALVTGVLFALVSLLSFSGG